MIPTIPNLRARLGACRGVLVDTNILLDIATNDPHWNDWSEMSIAYTTIEALDAALPITLYQCEALPGRRVSWPESVSCCTAAAENCAVRLCRISTLAGTLPSDALPC